MIIHTVILGYMEKIVDFMSIMPRLQLPKSAPVYN